VVVVRVQGQAEILSMVPHRISGAKKKEMVLTSSLEFRFAQDWESVLVSGLFRKTFQ
jgi:hypothetical protein